jgi:transposase
MAFKPLRMDKREKIIKYRSQGISIKKTARLLGISKNTVKVYWRQYQESKQVDEESEINSEALEFTICASEADKDIKRDKELQVLIPEYYGELRKVGVTRYLLWKDYIESHPDGYSYSRFCRKFKDYRRQQEVTIKLEHEAAYRLSVDYTGKKIPYVDKATGEVKYAEVLVSTMPYSAHTFACAVPSQKQEDFISGINAALLYMGGLPKVIQSDNLKSFVIKADRYEPTFNQLCVQMSSFYGVEIEATRSGKPKDKASVERHVAIVYNKIFAPLRDEVFTSIEQINQAFRPLIDEMNCTKFQGKDYSRRDIYIQDEKPHLRSLPSQMFELQKSTMAKVQMNYHVILGEDRHQYSVPYIYVSKRTQIVYTSSYVHIYCDSERIAVHDRDRRKHAYSTLPAHMPEKHLRFLERKGWDATYFKREARRIGENTLWAMTELLKSKSLIEQTYNSCLGILSLKGKYSATRLENACAKARTTHRVNYGIIKNILKNKTDLLEQQPDLFSLPSHENIRGANEYQ